MLKFHSAVGYYKSVFQRERDGGIMSYSPKPPGQNDLHFTVFSEKNIQARYIIKIDFLCQDLLFL